MKDSLVDETYSQRVERKKKYPVNHLTRFKKTLEPIWQELNLPTL